MSPPPQKRPWSGADRALAGIVLLLAFSSPLARPLLGALDPRGLTAAAIRAGDPRDPWGTPWVERSGAGLFRMISAGPDRTARTADDLTLDFYEGPMLPTGFSFIGGVDEPYFSAPAVPIAIAVVLLLTRKLSGVPTTRRSARFRVGSALAIALLPTVLTIVVLLVALLPNSGVGRWIHENPTGLRFPVEGAVGSLYLLFAAWVFAHRELSPHGHTT